MKTILLVWILMACGAVAVGADRTVVVPLDDAVFTVGQDDVVRLMVRGISGSTITPRISGPAKLENTHTVREVANGQFVIGTTRKEYDLLPTGTGQVRATFVVQPPQPGSPQIQTTYTFEVK